MTPPSNLPSQAVKFYDERHKERQQCSNCRFFQPRFHAIGACRRQYSANSKFWSTDDKSDVLVHVSHVCGQYEEATDPTKETI